MKYNISLVPLTSVLLILLASPLVFAGTIVKNVCIQTDPSVSVRDDISIEGPDVSRIWGPMPMKAYAGNVGCASPTGAAGRPDYEAPPLMNGTYVIFSAGKKIGSYTAKPIIPVPGTPEYNVPIPRIRYDVTPQGGKITHINEYGLATITY